jgi:thiol-disulfide isomerase/thioredoxin
MRKILIYLCCIAAVFMTIGCDKQSDDRKPGADRAATGVSQSTANKVPHFALPSVIDGTIVDSDEYAGRVRLINFFATWCPPCLEEVPTLVKLEDKFGDKGFSVIGLSVDEDGSEIVKQFVDKMKVNYTVLLTDEAIRQAFGGVSGIPSTFLVTQDGIILRKYLGYVDRDILEKDILEILN